MPQQSLVQTWLAAIGLAPEILETFEAAGIVNPKDLAELEICHYPALGVRQASDRKKLFYLVQRVKLAVPDDGGDDDEQHDANNGGGSNDDLNDILDFSSVNESNVGNNEKSKNAASSTSSTNASQRWQKSREEAIQNGTRNARSNSRRVRDVNQIDDEEYTSNFDTEEEDDHDDDGVDAALQEQYKPLLSPSTSADLLSEDESDDLITSDEDVPSPPRNGRTNITTSTNSSRQQQQHDFESSDDHDDTTFDMNQQSPFRNKREEAFLTRRNARLAKIASPNRRKTEANSTTNANTTTTRENSTNRMMTRTRAKGSDKEKTNTTSRTRKTSSVSNAKSLNKSYTSTATASSTRRLRSSKPTSSSSNNDDTSHTQSATTSTTTTTTSSSSTSRRNPSRDASKRLNTSTSSTRTSTNERERKLEEIKSRRTSKRLQEKQARERLNLNKNNNKSTSNPRSSSLSDQDDQESSTTQLSGSTNASRKPLRTSATSSSNSLDSILDDNGFPTSPESGNASDSSSNSRRSRGKASKGPLNPTKRLATIPSGRIMPPSSLSHDEGKDYDSIFPDEPVNNSSMNRRSINLRKSNSVNIGIRNDKSYQNSMSNRAKSTPKPRENLSQHSISRTMTNDDLELNAAHSAEMNENIDTNSNGQQQRRKSIKPNSNTNGMVFVHGKRKKETWTAKVDSLREANDQLYQDQMKVEHLDAESDEEMRIRVVVRKRPMSRKEAAHADDADVIHPLRYNDYGRILVYQPKTRVDLTREVETLPFAFDNVFPEDSDNSQIYDDTIKSLIPGAFEGRWASVFAYGQTGSGKTFTMMGSTLTGIKARNRNVKHDKNHGLYLLAARDLFTFARKKEYSHFTIGASLFEIYGGKLFDLLNDRAPVKCLENHQGRVCFPGLSEHVISSAEDLMKLIEKGASNRSTGSTSANRDSSRSHAVLQLHLRKPNSSKIDEEHGRLTFIDLAGSERGADTDQASRTTRLEGAEINTSLLALKEVIRALATGDAMTHIPFRGSKLTQVLKESFVGKNSRTVMVACVAPNMTNCEHTLNTLRYADRVKERNSETGKLSASVEAASRITNKQITSNFRPVTAPPAGTDLSRVQSKASLAKAEDEILQSGDDNWLSDLDNDDEVDLHDDDDILKVSMDELNEVLKTPVHDTAKSFTFEDEDSPKHKSSKSASSKVKNKKEAVAPLINTHRSIMSEMLSMVKQEMTLVNCTDEDRALIDDYLQELEQIQDKQLAMISTLRESLVQYYGTRPSGEELDDSFEALLSS